MNFCKDQSKINIKNRNVIDWKFNADCPSFNREINLKDFFQSSFSISKNILWLSKSKRNSPSFEELHYLLFQSIQPNIYELWPNYFQLKMNLSYPYTQLTESLFIEILQNLNIPIRFVLEVGSFTGKSTINIAKTLLNRKSSLKFVLLCIDTWLGGLEHWIDKRQRQLMSTKYGRPIVYEQFLANILFYNLTEYVIPFSTTSILGARFLLEKKLFPQIIYLDSAHLEGETYLELQLYWLILEEGGILLGDDYSWTTVRCDLLRFSQNINQKINLLGYIWFIKKTKVF